MTAMKPSNRTGAAEATEQIEPLALHRAVADLRCGDPVVLVDGMDAAVLVAAEMIDDERLTDLRRLARNAPVMAVTRHRAAALGFGAAHGDAGGATIELGLSSGAEASTVLELADPTRLAGGTPALVEPRAGDSLGAGAVELMKLAGLLPAALMQRLPLDAAHGLARSRGFIVLQAASVAQHRAAWAASLKRVTDARVPLADAENARLIAFRPDDGGIDHLAIVVGDPPADEPVLARIHSECFTGDLLGSLRCDCGEQLRGAIRAMAANPSGGIVLYLAQEGRGIGLVNKLRAYRLQDEGLDTIDANRELGFEADERNYQPAAAMLRQLGFGRVRLMTNNPAKVEALAKAGIEVVERVPHAFAPNAHNDAYLATKRSRAGHLL